MCARVQACVCTSASIPYLLEKKKKKWLPVDLRLCRTRTQKPSPWACERDNPSIKSRRLNATSHHAVKHSGHYSKLIKHQTSDRNRIRISRYGSQLSFITMPVATRNDKHVSQSMPSRRLIQKNVHKAPPPPLHTPLQTDRQT